MIICEIHAVRFFLVGELIPRHSHMLASDLGQHRLLLIDSGVRGDTPFS